MKKLSKLSITFIICALLMILFFKLNYIFNLGYDFLYTCGIVQGLCTLAGAMVIDDTLNYNRITRLIYTNLSNIPFIMNSLYKFDKNLYNNIMEELTKLLERKVSTLENFISIKKKKCLQENKNFDKKQHTDLYSAKILLQDVKNVDAGIETWETICIQHDLKNNQDYAIKYALNELPKEEIDYINSEKKRIEFMRKSNKVIL